MNELDKWKEIKRKDPPISESINLASLEATIDIILERRAVKSPELIHEEPVLLMIIAEGGVLTFSYPFLKEWNRDADLFGSFLSAVNSFSDEFFSQGLDRVKFGEYMIILKPLTTFSVFYIFKGQTYLADQKLTHFIESIEGNSSIMQILKNSYQTNQVIEIKDFPFLEIFITNIFKEK